MGKTVFEMKISDDGKPAITFDPNYIDEMSEYLKDSMEQNEEVFTMVYNAFASFLSSYSVETRDKVLDALRKCLDCESRRTGGEFRALDLTMRRDRDGKEWKSVLSMAKELDHKVLAEALSAVMSKDDRVLTLMTNALVWTLLDFPKDRAHDTLNVINASVLGMTGAGAN